jgi:hypothetical protein
LVEGVVVDPEPDPKVPLVEGVVVDPEPDPKVPLVEGVVVDPPVPDTAVLLFVLVEDAIVGLGWEGLLIKAELVEVEDGDEDAYLLDWLLLLLLTTPDEAQS